MQMDNFQNLSKEELIKLLHQSIAERNKAKVELDKAKAELAKKNADSFRYTRHL